MTKAIMFDVDGALGTAWTSVPKAKAAAAGAYPTQKPRQKRVGQGTTVRLYLPRISERFEEEPVSVNLIEAPRAEQGESVPIVDDDPSDRPE